MSASSWLVRLTPCSGNNLCVDLGSGVPKQTIDIFNRSASLAQSIWMFIIHFLQRYPVRSTNGPYFIALSGTRFSSSRGTSPFWVFHIYHFSVTSCHLLHVKDWTSSGNLERFLVQKRFCHKQGKRLDFWTCISTNNVFHHFLRDSYQALLTLVEFEVLHFHWFHQEMTHSLKILIRCKIGSLDIWVKQSY